MSDLLTSNAPVPVPVPAQKRAPADLAALRRRRSAVVAAKYLLPLAALLLLSSIALWPEISSTLSSNRVTWHRLTMVDSNSGQMLAPRYHGLDGRDRPYMVSADTARRHGPERLDLVAPKGDVTLANGSWMMVKSRIGVFIQHINELDLSDDVMLYRQDGTIMTTATATMNMKAGAADSEDFTHAEGPFGTLDAQGFSLFDKGDVIQFHGPAKLVLNGTH